MTGEKALFKNLDESQKSEIRLGYNKKVQVEGKGTIAFRTSQDLQRTVDTVKSVLEDADAKQEELSCQETVYIEELKDALYDANDVLDEFVTLVKQKQLNEANDKLSDKVSSILSRFTRHTRNLSSNVNKVKKRLDAIASNSSKFLFKVSNEQMRRKKLDTSSFVSANDVIIGRDKDVEKIVEMLLDYHDVDQPGVLSLAIVGIGGLGKTALAQLVYNDPRVTSAFQLRSWTCIADQDQEHWNLTEFLGKVVKDLPVDDHKRDLTSLEQMQLELQKHLGGEKYLIVLDDVWTESYHKWMEFEKFLKVGQSGSRIIVTTRSKKTAKMVGNSRVHELRGLSEDDSWHLFERMAFDPEQRENPDDDLVKIGKKIVKKCGYVPLAIRLVGSLLHGETKIRWLLFQDKELANIGKIDNSMNHILKLSYHQLDSALKSCFTYCAIFPKDFEIDKHMLISLWMAQGYICDDSVGEEYFLTLLQRCFFQDVIEDKWGQIVRFKIHDLLHDIAEQVAGTEISRVTSDDTHNVSNRIHHLALLYGCYTQEIFSMTRIRTFLQINAPWTEGSTDQLLEGKSIQNWTCLRSLDLSRLGAESLPESLCKLIHLRYLNLSGSEKLKELPKSITKLVNLQTLDLYACSSLLELPKDVSKLVDLSTLNVTSCYKLSCMPRGMGLLTRLHTLGLFVVGRASSDGKQCFDGLEGLHSLNNLKGNLRIRIGARKNVKYVKEDHGEGAYLRSKERLKRIAFYFKRDEEYGNMEDELALLEEMQPHHDLRELELSGYHGKTMPRWPRREDNSILFHLPNLVTLVILECPELLYLPLETGKLPNLKQLELWGLPNMEFMVNVNAGGEELSFFPCLEVLNIHGLSKLKGWWPRTGSSLQPSSCFAHLKELEITDCPLMTSFPVSSGLQALRVENSGILLKWKIISQNYRPNQPVLPLYSKQKMLIVNHLEWLKLMPAEYIQCVATIHIIHEKNVESLGKMRELFQTCIFSSLLSIVIKRCPKLRSDGGWLEQLSALHNLHIEDCPNFLEGIAWQCIPRNLQSLSLVNFTELEELPEGMQYCTFLTSLTIWNLPNLKAMPNWMPKLVSLQKLQLRYCSLTFTERCRTSNGDDWSLIQHIPILFIPYKEE
ncbi:putative disease resistance protein RGA1 [Silene latifolia]|uniref:putative disease resistance protein RGA1 n=1 Tax=Silene latifolia TaxID=37657 RepID=UPI003D77B4FC